MPCVAWEELTFAANPTGSLWNPLDAANYSYIVVQQYHFERFLDSLWVNLGLEF